jgi:hypothetical protein
MYFTRPFQENGVGVEVQRLYGTRLVFQPAESIARSLGATGWDTNALGDDRLVLDVVAARLLVLQMVVLRMIVLRISLRRLGPERTCQFDSPDRASVVKRAF